MNMLLIMYCFVQYDWLFVLNIGVHVYRRVTVVRSHICVCVSYLACLEHVCTQIADMYLVLFILFSYILRVSGSKGMFLNE